LQNCRKSILAATAIISTTIKARIFMKNKTFYQAQKQIAVTVLAMLMLAMNSMAADVVMTASDASGSDSFDTAGHWSSGQAPSAGNNYFSLGFTIRTTTGTAPLTFHGDSLTLSNAATAAFPWVSLALKGDSGDVATVNNLIMQTNSGIGNISNSGGATDWIAGNISVQGPVTMSDVNSAPRWIGISATLSGSGPITNACLVIYGANNSSFTGPLVAVFSPSSEMGAIIVTNEAAMGGNPASFNAAQLELNRGIFRAQGSFALDHSNAGITIDSGGGIFDIASGTSLTNYEPIAGSGIFSFTNSGTFVDFGSAASFTGTLAINNGTFILGSGGSLASANTIAPASGATFDVTATGLSLVSGETLAGNGTVIGNVSTSSGSKLSPGGSSVAATLSISGNLTLSGGTTLACDFLSTNDVIAVGGNFSPSGVTTIQLGSVPAIGTYPLFTVAGALGGSSANFSVSALSTRSKNYAVVYDSVSTPKRVLLQVTSSGSAANLVWQGDVINGVNNVWDINTSPNWLNGVSSDVYYDADNVSFTDVGATNQPVVLNVTVNPGSVSFVSSSNYTLIGSGAIAGAIAVIKGGTGTLTLSNTNTYVGGTIVTNGILQLGYTNATGLLGAPSGATPLVSVSGTGTFNINGSAIDNSYTAAVQINGNGFSSTQGAVDNSIGGLTSGGGDIGIASLSLAGNSTVSATSNWQIGHTGKGITGSGYTLTKIGNAYLYLETNAVSAVGNFIIAGGGVLFWDHADALGTTAIITLTNGGFIDTWNPATQYGGLTFYNSIIVSDPVNGGSIYNIRTPYNHPPSDIYNGSVTLNGTLTFSNNAFVAANQYNNNQNSFGKITMNGNISGTGGVIAQGGTAQLLGSGNPEFYGGNLVTFNGNNSYSGPTLVTNLIQLLITTANQSGGSYDIVDYGTLDVAVASGKPTIPMSNLTLEQQILGPGNLGFTRLASMPTSPVVYATNLIINAGVILPPIAGYSIGQFPLIKYDGTIGGNGYGGLALGMLPAGVTASLTNNTVNHTIDLLVTTAGITWTGANSTNWDTGTVNWFNPVSSLATTYADGQTVVFDDSSSVTNVNITQIVQPGGITINATKNYTFSHTPGAGSINGTGALIKNGSGTLTITATNNNFTGGTFITGGTIKLAGTNDNFGYPHGGGALNNNLGIVNIANGGTLDINGTEVPNYQSFGPEGYNVFISGAGVGGNGALVNNDTNDNDLADPGYVTLTGDTTVGGSGDINIRMGVSPQLSSQSSAYTLTKVGSGQFRIRYVTTVSTNFGAINILQGNVTYESSSALGLGDSTKPIYVGNGGGFGWGTAAAACVRPLICSNGAAIIALNITNNVFNSPVTLVSGNINLSGNFYNGMIFSNVISGAGGMTLQFQSLATLAASNTYSGNTTVANANSAGGGNNGSVLKLVGNGSIEHSASISLQGVTASQAFPGALDVSGRTDGTLTLLNGQMLRGDNGSYVKGNVVATSGTMITPGGTTNIQFMTISNNLTLQAGSTMAMDVSLDGGLTNDLVKVTGLMAYGGTLQLTNIGVTALTNGAAFKLFSNGTFSGNFATISGSPGSGLGWSFNPTNGIATVVATVAINPTNITVSVSGNQLTLSWPSDHLGWTLQAQTNALGAGLSTNWFDVPGSSSSTQAVININPNAPTVFYRLRL
jgi:fibronectin-binding autotransporter adhesin